MYVPNRPKIFLDIDYEDACADVNCRCIAFVGKHNHPVCDATSHESCPRVTLKAEELKAFVAEHYEMLAFLEPGGSCNG